MPRVSMFFGIVILMYYDEHFPPHFHALYEGEEASFDLDGNLLKGMITGRAKRLVKEWAELHKKELQENWNMARQNLPLNWIEPLR